VGTVWPAEAILRELVEGREVGGTVVDSCRKKAVSSGWCQSDFKFFKPPRDFYLAPYPTSINSG
jgi:hypothetical protein